jgi:hypothetical protein
MPLLGSPKVCGATRRCIPADALHVRVAAGRDSRRFSDSGEWGYAVFDFDNASSTFTPGAQAGHPPQANDTERGLTRQTNAKTRDYVLTNYGRRGAKTRGADLPDRSAFSGRNCSSDRVYRGVDLKLAENRRNPHLLRKSRNPRLHRA